MNISDIITTKSIKRVTVTSKEKVEAFARSRKGTVTYYVGLSVVWYSLILVATRYI